MKRRILVVDDEAHFRFSTRVALRKVGYEVVEAEDGAAALAIIGSGKSIDLIILDLNMPRVSGETVVTVLRGKGIRIPIIAISGLVDRFLTNKLIRRGCAAFMEKPFTPQELVRTVDALLTGSSCARGLLIDGLPLSAASPPEDLTADGGCPGGRVP